MEECLSRRLIFFVRTQDNYNLWINSSVDGVGVTRREEVLKVECGERKR